MVYIEAEPSLTQYTIQLAMMMLTRATSQRTCIPRGDTYFEAILQDNFETDKEILGL